MRPIGVFDSGVGGISVLKQALIRLPGEDYVYFGDNLHAPYGTRSCEEIRRLTLRCVEQMACQPLKALVVACNTATSAAVDMLRARFSFPVIGMEPAIKPALEKTSGKVLVMATPATLKLEKFQYLRHRLDNQDRILPLPCPELVEFIERGVWEGPELMHYLEDKLAPFHREAGAVVLGCTHFIFVRSAIHEILPGCPVVDGNDGTIRHLAQCLQGLTESRTKGAVFLHTTGRAEHYLPIMQALLDKPMDIETQGNRSKIIDS